MTKRKPPENPVTPTADAAFDLCVRKWQDKLNLHDWRICRSSKAAGKANMAEITKTDLAARLATYRVGTDFGSQPVTEQSVEEIACHEVLHVFLCELLEFVANPAATDADKESAEHRVINTLVHLLVPQVD